MTDYEALLRALVGGRVEFFLIGGAAAIAHGSARLTEDLDILYRRSEENIARIVAALDPFSPYLRGAPPGLPFRWDAPTVRGGLNFTLETTTGDIDLFGEITGGGIYEDLVGETVVLQVFGLECRCIGLDALIRVKRAAGRPKDLEVLAELEDIRGFEEEGE